MRQDREEKMKRIIFVLLPILNWCSHRFSAEIYISSQTYWFVDEKFLIGEGGNIKAYAYITDYSESPYLFDSRGVAKAYKVSIEVACKVLCQDKVFSEDMYFDEVFAASDPVSYRSAVSRARLSLKNKIKVSIIAFAKSNCK